MRNWYVLSLALLALFGVEILASSAQAQVRSDLRLFSDSFISPSFEANQKTNYQFVGMSLKSSPYTDEALKMDIEGAVAFGAPLLNYLNISEAYFQNKQSDTEQLIIGRKLMDWNELDNRWDFGLWQPLFQWNPLNAEQQGLTGLFWQAERPSYSILMFASHIFIPNQGPTFEISDGSFVRGNPWFRRPPESVRIFEEVTQVDYNFERPESAQVVFQTSYGARLSFGSAESVKAQLSYMYKPSNELAIGYGGVLDTSRLRGVVDLKPQSFYHSLSGFDFSHRLGMFRYGASIVMDRPQKDLEFEEKWTHPTFEDALLTSPFVELIGKQFTLSLQALNITGGEVTEIGDMASADRAPLTMRYPFQQAVKVALETRHVLKNQRRLTSRTSFTTSQTNDFDYLQFKVNYRLSSSWATFTELELVRAGELTAQNQNEIAQYKNLDRFMAGASYVF
ncbi:hypothetical protein [Bdellovibrio sp. HCB337]|uniref:hypothetical protein n=1 Tax=Bdellovibrio sp. HCB337 TaxID=3394358 RepID=UPI0039A447DC